MIVRRGATNMSKPNCPTEISYFNFLFSGPVSPAISKFETLNETLYFILRTMSEYVLCIIQLPSFLETSTEHGRSKRQREIPSSTAIGRIHLVSFVFLGLL